MPFGDVWGLFEKTFCFDLRIPRTPPREGPKFPLELQREIQENREKCGGEIFGLPKTNSRVVLKVFPSAVFRALFI